jgi:putative sterol carrier protein
MSDNKQDRRPKTIMQALEGMALTFNPEKAENLEAVIQFDLRDDAAGKYYLNIHQGKCTFHKGEHEEPTLTIITPSDVWLKIARKEMSGAVAMMTGKYKTSGDAGILLKMDKIFSRQPSEKELAEKGWI